MGAEHFSIQMNLFWKQSGIIQPESEWIDFYHWDANFITNCASYFKVQMLDMRNDSNDRMYFVWRRS